MAPKIILAIVTPLLSLTSIRIGLGLELSIAEPVVSEVLKWNPITVHVVKYRRFYMYRVKKFTGHSPPRRLSSPFYSKRKRKEGIKKSTPVHHKLPNYVCILNFHPLPEFTSCIVKQTLPITLRKLYYGPNFAPRCTSNSLPLIKLLCTVTRSIRGRSVYASVARGT